MGKGKANRLIIGGFLFIVLMSVTVFYAMNSQMEERTQEDVRQVAQSYVEGIAMEEMHHATTIADIRFGQAFHMVDWVNSHADVNSADSVAAIIQHVCLGG